MADTDRQQFSDLAAVVVPLPAQGHLNQLLHLSCRIAARGIPVYYLASTTHIRQAKLRAHGWDAAVDSLHFREFSAIPCENPQPDPSAPAKFPSQLVPSLHASMLLRRPVFEFASDLSRNFRKLIVIYDDLMSYVVQDIGSIQNAEPFGFRSISAFTFCAWNAAALPEAPEILKLVPSMDGYYSPGFGDFLKLQKGARKISVGEIYNSNNLIEGLYLDLLDKWKEEKIWGLGPFHFLPGEISVSKNPDSCLSWLENQISSNSVIYVSFGTTTSFSDEQIREIAIGLEKSGHKFIWVLRDADKGDIFSGEARKLNLPDGFVDRVRDRGLIVGDWAPQVEILSHGATGGFLSHCGWNSCLESISTGVAMATWPLHSDQPGNAVLVTKVLRIGIEVKAWSRGEELVASGTVERAVRALMGPDGEEVRERAENFGKAVRESMMEGGAAWKELELFISHIAS